MSGGAVWHLSISPDILLRERVSSAMENVPFYQDLYSTVGGFARARGASIPEGPEFLEWFRTLPIVGKSQLQAAGGQGLANPRHDPSRLVEKPTSGSTGIPFVLHLDPTLINFRRWRFQRPHQTVVHAPPSALVYIFPWDFVVRSPRELQVLATASSKEDAVTRREHRVTTFVASPSTGATFESLPKKTRRVARESRTNGAPTRTGAKLDRPFTVNSLLPTRRLYETLAALSPATLVGFASTLAALARWMCEEKATLPSVRQVWTRSELLAPDGADAIREVLGCEPLTIYASNEFGFMAWESAAGEPMPFEPDRLHVELLTVDGARPAVPGEFARVVVTDLLNDTMPLIRYDIGDIARVAGPREVAPGLIAPSIVDLQGKEPDLLDGAAGGFTPTFEILGTIKDLLPHAQYRFVGLGKGRYVLQYTPGVGFSADRLDPTIKALRDILGDAAEIAPQRVARISREASGKLRPVVNLHRVHGAQRIRLARDLELLDLLPTLAADTAGEIVADTLLAIGMVSGATAAQLHPDLELYADLGLDSLRFVQLVVELEDAVGQPIDDEDLLDVDLVTVGDLTAFVEKMLG